MRLTRQYVPRLRLLRLQRADRKKHFTQLSEIVEELAFVTEITASDDQIQFIWDPDRDDLFANIGVKREGWKIWMAQFGGMGNPFSEN